MKLNNEYIYNKEYLVIVPSMSDTFFNSISYTFGNAFLLENNNESYNNLISLLKNSNFKKIILVDFAQEYEQIMFMFSNRFEYSFIYTGTLGELSNNYKYTTYKRVIDMFNKNNAKIGIIDYGMYLSLNKKYKNVYYITLDIERVPSKKVHSNTIGLLNDAENPTHSYYNELSAISIIKDAKAKILNENFATRGFLKLFGIKNKRVKKFEELYTNNIANLYINFTNTNNEIFLKSMDQEIPCIIGNSTILDEDSYLKSMLVLDSDDDVNEMAQKVESAISKHEEIFKEYNKFRTKYSKECRKKVETFLDCQIDNEQNSEDEILLSVIVPVYNTEKYLEKCLNSIMRAKIKRMEIIIINDGSPDEAQTIIDKYEKKYPKLIKVISQKNHGIGYVRNVGLKNAKGKYIVSVDSDDTISKKYFKDALKYMKEDIDIIMCDWNTQYDYGTYQTPALDKVYDNIGAYKGLLYTTIMPSPCNKIVKKSLFTKIHLTYHEDIYEDLSAIPFILLTAKTIKYIPNPYYEYYIRSGSIMRSKPGNSMIDVINIINERLEKYKEKIKVDINEFKYYTYSWRIEEYIINPLYDLDEEKMLKSIKYIYDNFMPNLKELFESPLYEEMLNKLENKEKVKYIKERNKKVFEKKLEEFIKDKNKKNKIMKLTPPEIVYGKE